MFIFQVLQDASKAGLSIKGNQTSDGFWKFTSSAVFAATVVTTIGQMIFIFFFIYNLTHTHTHTHTHMRARTDTQTQC